MSVRLEFSQVGRVFDTPERTVEALRAVSFVIDKGDFVALVGPSGCGKSTLLNIASGLDSGYSGTLTAEPAYPITSLMFQAPRLLDWRTVRKNVSLPLEARGMDGGAVKERTEEELRKVGLGDVLDSFPGQLSGGMQQRVALARSLAPRPDLLLMDEPFSALDEFTARRLRAEVVKLVAEEGATVVLVTHDVAEACFLADRVVVMGTKPGRVLDEVTVGVPRPRDYEDEQLVAVRRRVMGTIDQSG